MTFHWRSQYNNYKSQ